MSFLCIWGLHSSWTFWASWCFRSGYWEQKGWSWNHTSGLAGTACVVWVLPAHTLEVAYLNEPSHSSLPDKTATLSHMFIDVSLPCLIPYATGHRVGQAPCNSMTQAVVLTHWSNSEQVFKTPGCHFTMLTELRRELRVWHLMFIACLPQEKESADFISCDLCADMQVECQIPWELRVLRNRQPLESSILVSNLWCENRLTDLPYIADVTGLYFYQLMSPGDSWRGMMK